MYPAPELRSSLVPYPELSIFENYSDWYFLYGKFRTSLSWKLPFIKKTDQKRDISTGHHALDSGSYYDIEKETYWCPLVPVHHFKWGEDTEIFLEKSLYDQSKKTHKSLACVGNLTKNNSSLASKCIDLT